VVKDYSALPDDVYDVCTPTTGSREIIDVTKDGSGEQWVALDLIATFGVLTIMFSIDSHPMYIYAVDGAFIEPIQVDAIPIQNGARFSVLVRLQDLGNFNMRLSSIGASQSLSNYAVLSYNDAGQPAPNTPSVAYINDIGVGTSPNVRIFTQSQMRMFPAQTIPETADDTFVLSMIAAGQTYLWALNNTIYPLTHQQEPALLFNPQPFVSNNVTISTRNNTWVDLVFVTATWPQPPHPMHKHAGKMFMIGAGTGPFPWASVEEARQAQPGSFNLDNPPRRDTFATAATTNNSAWLAVRYYSNDPGAWLVHCHIAPHFDGGMSVAIQDGVDVFPTIPPEYLNF
jgi:FtsP/CotA-like multicopper oxidase with cupredoxin domain